MLSNDSKVNLEVKELSHPISESLAETSKMPVTTSKQSEEYNLLFDQSKVQNKQNFTTLGNISEQERVEIIQKGF